MTWKEEIKKEDKMQLISDIKLYANAISRDVDELNEEFAGGTLTQMVQGLERVYDLIKRNLK